MPNPISWVDPLGLSCKEGKESFFGLNKDDNGDWRLRIGPSSWDGFLNSKNWFGVKKNTDGDVIACFGEEACAHPDLVSDVTTGDALTGAIMVAPAAKAKSLMPSPKSTGGLSQVSPRVVQARQRQADMLDDNVGYNISPKAWDSYPTIGRNGTFISDNKGITDVIGDLPKSSQQTLTKAKASELEQAFGLDSGTLQDGFKVRRVDNITDRMTRSPLEGNEHFLGPGNHLPGGAPEMVIDSIPTIDGGGITTLLEVTVK